MKIAKLVLFILILSILINKAFALENDKKIIINSIGMKFVLIPPGTFLMGSPESEIGHDYTEEQHKVTITKGFYMQTTEVTQGQWERVMGCNPSFFSNCGKNCPVENVSFYDVMEFIKRLNEIEKDKGRKYRLPTEAEWEYACRAGTTTPFYNGGTITEKVGFCNESLNEIAWYYCNSKEGTHPVAQKEPNSWGLYDMIGNVWEWTQDWYSKYPFGYRLDKGGPPKSWSKVKRGGSWRESPFFCRVAFRGSERPEVRAPDIGFRLAMDIPLPVDHRKQPPCPPAKPAPPKPEKKISTCLSPCIAVKDILFDLDSYKIRDDMKPILDEVVKIAKEKNVEIYLRGHTCNLGSRKYNMLLSKRRVKAVQNYLIEKGISSDKIYISYYGEERPRVPNSDEAHRKLNRRVEIRVLGIAD